MSELIDLPDGHAVLRSSTVKLPLLGVKLRVHKVHVIPDDRDYELAYDAARRQVDLDDFLKRERALFVQTYGKLHPVLHRALQGDHVTKNVQVVVWVRADSAEPPKSLFDEADLLLDELPKAIKKHREETVLRLRTLGAKFVAATAAKLLSISTVAPAMVFDLGREQLQALAALDEVMLITLHEPEGVDDLQSSLDISKAQQVVYADGDRAQDVRVGVWESGPDDATDLSIEARFASSGAASSDHARLTTGIIKNRQARGPHGYAPDCKVYSANDRDTAALEWAVVERCCRVISQSFHRSSEQSDGELSSDDVLKDYLAVHFPYPTIIQAAGNITGGENPDEYVNHKGYNSLAVGSHNDGATAMASSTTWRNPVSPHGDRELPEICANGTGVSAVGLTKSGTSFAAPAVAGAAAVLMGIDNCLKAWPEGVRAILLAGATVNVRGENWHRDNLNDRDARDGAGALDIGQAARIARHKKTTRSAGSSHGYAIGTWHPEDFSRNGYARDRFKVRIPASGATHVKVALAWDSKAWRSWPFGGSSLDLDLDLRIFRGSTLVAHSSSWDNSYEIADYDGHSGEELTIRIRRFSGSEWTYFGVAWAVF